VSPSSYRIESVDRPIDTAATAIVRSAAGKLDLDDLQPYGVLVIVGYLVLRRSIGRWSSGSQDINDC
jgi:hypothetical protein